MPSKRWLEGVVIDKYYIFNIHFSKLALAFIRNRRKINKLANKNRHITQ